MKQRKQIQGIRLHENEQGFTLLELCIVILIIGLLTVPLTHLYSLYNSEMKVLATRDRIDATARSLALFSPTRFPCPADRSLPPTHVNYGYEQCTGIPACTAAYQGICRVDGTRDTVIDADLTPDPVLIGGVPFRVRIGAVTVPLPQLTSEDTFDGWNRRFTYAVSERLSDPAKTSSIQDFKFGVIAAQDENGNPTAGIAAMGDAQLVIISHGPTGFGAFSSAGSFLPCAAASTDRENCDNDNLFVQGIGYYQAGAANFYDDTVRIYLEKGGSLWTSLNDSAGQPTPHLNNLNTSNVGVNIATPTQRLDVSGTLRADTVRTQTYCNKAGGECFDTDYFGGCKANGTIAGCTNVGAGATNTCGTTGAIMTGIDSLRVECSKPTLNLPGTFAGVSCTGIGNWVRGVLTNGCIICTNGVKVCP